MTRFALCLILLATPLGASPIAEVLCGPSGDMRERLKRDHRATLTATGLRSPESVIEVWTGEEGNWTLVMAYSDGRRCIVAMGESWELTLPPNPA